MTQSFKAFRAQGFRNKVENYNKNAVGQTMSIQERQDREHNWEEQNKRDLSALLELRDIDDELTTIQRLLKHQKETVGQMVVEYTKSPLDQSQKANGLGYLEEAVAKIEEYEKQIIEMQKSANLAKDSYKDLLDIKQKQANVDEARMARWQADVSQSQSRSIMVFTVITIVFLPLTFFTGLFGMNIQQWSGEEKNVSAHTVAAIALPVTVGIILIAVFIAFNNRLRQFSIQARKIVTGILSDCIDALAKVLGIRWAFQQARTRKWKPKTLEFLLEKYTQPPNREIVVDDDIWRDVEEQTRLPFFNTVPRSNTNRSWSSSVRLRKYLGLKVTKEKDAKTL
ncbi:MAG: hypothetical protein Q9227_007689 [Pyrenula ochraceoflavens]